MHTLVIFQAMFYRICFLLYVSKVCCPRCKYSMGIKLAWYFFFFLFEFGSFKNNGPSMSIFNTLHIVFSCGVRSSLFSFFPGSRWGGGWAGLSWGNCPLNFKWHYRKSQKGDGLCCTLYWMLSWLLFPCPPVRSKLCMRSGAPVTLASDRVD